MARTCLFFLLTLVVSFSAEARLPEISPPDVNSKVAEIMRAHVSHKAMTPQLMERTLKRFVEELDPSKTYFIATDIEDWIHPEPALLDRVFTQYQKSDFSTFQRIHEVMLRAIERRNRIESEIASAELPKDVSAKEFKDLDWAKDDAELKDRLLRIKALQAEAAQYLEEDQRDLSLQRIAKRRQKYEEDLLENDPVQRERLLLSKVLKSIASSLDAHTAYFTPGEAAQFMISVQQRLFGIGAQLRDDLNGFSVVKIIEGGPAAEGKLLKAKDRIIAVNGEPVVGMDIIDAVELIRGHEGTSVDLTVMREVGVGSEKHEERVVVPIVRGEVVLKETRLESSVEPFADGAIAYLKLFSFYQDPESSSAQDITREVQKLQQEHNLKGIVLDLRYNAGGMLSQAVAVTGLFITRGVVVSIKDDAGRLQHLRDLDGKTLWDGPLVVLTNRASASAAEIVAQTLQDYGRGIIVGDDHTFGKGTFQTFTLNAARQGEVNPEGEYKVTRGTYFTVSGTTPQLHGVQADIVVPGALSKAEIGEQYAKFALEADQIGPLFDDQLMDLPERQRQRVGPLYRMNLQSRLEIYKHYLPKLIENSKVRLANHKGYQSFIEKIGQDEVEPDDFEQFDGVDFQKLEAYSIIKDLIVLMHS